MNFFQKLGMKKKNKRQVQASLDSSTDLSSFENDFRRPFDRTVMSLTKHPGSIKQKHVQNANVGLVPDTKLDASAVTSKNKSSNTIEKSARQVKTEEAKVVKPKYVYPPTKLLDPKLNTFNYINYKNNNDIEIKIEQNSKDSQLLSKFSIEYIDSQMTGREFEIFTKELLENNGFINVSVTPSTNDFGVDVLASDQHGVKFSIQCKKYQGKVDNKAVQEVFSSKAVHNCHVAAVLTNSYFTNNAIQLANINGVLLWDRSVLLNMMKNISRSEISNNETFDKSNTGKNLLHNNSGLNEYDSNLSNETEYHEIQQISARILDTLKNFGVSASINNISQGPVFTRYELQPAAGVKKSRVIDLTDDIVFSIGRDGVIIEPSISGKAAIGIVVPNAVTSMVTLRELIETDEFRGSKSKLNCVLGRDISGEIVCTDLSKMPHLLIAGTTGSGKSVCINALLMSILFKASPDEVKLLLIDTKMVEFSKYKGIPHLLIPVVSDAKKAAGALNWAVSEMFSRYRVFAEYDCKGVDSFNQLIDKNLKYIEEQKAKPDYDPEAEEQPCLEVEGLKVPTEYMSRIVIVVDELADLMMAAPAEVEEAICRLAQMARAAGMHLIIATNYLTKSVITNKLKEGIPSRIAFKVNSQTDSRTILDTDGAEKLIGRGDMLYSPAGAPKPIRVQCCFAKDEEIERVTGFIKKSHQAEYNAEIEDKIRKIAAEDLNGGKGGGKDSGAASSNAPDTDSMMEEAIKVVIEEGQASTGLLQRCLKVGYARAGRMIDDMEQMGIVGPHQGSKPRDVLMTYNEWLERNNLLGSPDDSEPDDVSDEDDPW